MKIKDYKPERELNHVLTRFEKVKKEFEWKTQDVETQLRSIEYGLSDIKEKIAKKEIAEKLNLIPVETLGCQAIKMKAVIFDLDDTIMGDIVNDTQTHKTLRNLMFTREQCGFPKLFVVSFTYSNEALVENMKENVLYDYFDGVYASSENKSAQVKKIMNIARAKPEETLFIGHDLIYDFQGIKENPTTAATNIRLIESRVSINDGHTEPINGACYIDGTGWRTIKREVMGLGGCVENTPLALKELKERTQLATASQQGWFGWEGWGGKEVQGTSSDKIGKARSLFSFLSRSKHPQEREGGPVQKAVDEKWPRKNIYNKAEEEYERDFEGHPY